MSKDNSINKTKTKINAIEGYAPHYTRSISNQAIISNQILSKSPTQLQNGERSVFMKEMNTQNLWTFELVTPGINVPIWMIVGFQKRERQDSQNLNKDTFYMPPVTIAQCVISTVKYPVSAFGKKY